MFFIFAGMAELADAHGSGPCESNFMQVRPLLPAPLRVFLQNLSGFVWHSLFCAVFQDFRLKFLRHGQIEALVAQIRKCVH